MAKKKNSQKKHTFKHVASHETAAPTAGVSATATTTAPKAASARTVDASGTTARDFSYVAGDMKRIGVIAVSLVALEVVLYFVLTHTSAGTAIYNLVKV